MVRGTGRPISFIVLKMAPLQSYPPCSGKLPPHTYGRPIIVAQASCTSSQTILLSSTKWLSISTSSEGGSADDEGDSEQESSHNDSTAADSIFFK